MPAQNNPDPQRTPQENPQGNPQENPDRSPRKEEQEPKGRSGQSGSEQSGTKKDSSGGCGCH